MTQVVAEIGGPTEEGLPMITLNFPEGGVPCEVKADFQEISRVFSTPNPGALDLLYLASVVYAIDRRVYRSLAIDNWTRHISLTHPVFLVEQWNRVRPELEKCLSFLTGDRWEIQFIENRSKPLLGGLGLPRLGVPTASTVCLFSGGLDSFIGAIDWLERNPRRSLLLVGHHDPRIAGPLSDQTSVYQDLQPFYAERISPLFLAVGANSGGDTTLRSRSFLFLALGLFAANSISPGTPLIIPENGHIALNVPLTPSRRGSCSTRTVHPYYLSLIRTISTELGIHNSIENPLALKTKGECVTECLNQEALRAGMGDTASCAKRGHRRTWIRKQAKECGRCLPCIYRRAAQHSADLDNQVYGRDICAGDVDLLTHYTYADDFRAIVSFLKRNPSEWEISKLLLSNGNLDLERLPEYSRMVKRAIVEVRRLIQDKGTDAVKRQVGV